VCTSPLPLLLTQTFRKQSRFIIRCTEPSRQGNRLNSRYLQIRTWQRRTIHASVHKNSAHKSKSKIHNRIKLIIMFLVHLRAKTDRFWNVVSMWSGATEIVLKHISDISN
jgi:hypothetical protein